MGYDRLQPGFLDRVFNSTISLPQQVIWRIWRAIEDDEVDLFSEKGLLDAALIPGLGVFDDHKEDVMPDYMAEQMGMASEGESGFVSQLGAAILSDPLTYMTGGLSAVGKVGKAATMAKRAPAMTKALREAAEKSGKSLDDMMRTMTPDDYLGYIDTAIDDVSKQGGKQAGRQHRHLEKMRSMMQSASSEASSLHRRRHHRSGMVGPPKPFKLTIDEAVKKTRDRQISIGLPVFHRWGAKYDVFDGYSSWWQLHKDGVNKGGTLLAKSMMLNKLVDLPGVGTTLKNLTSPVRHLRGGWQVGREAQVALARGDSLTPEEAQSFAKWLSPDGAAPVALDAHKAADKFGGREEVLEHLKAAYEEGIIKRNLTHEEAFKKAMNSVGIGSRKETGAMLYGRLTGRTADSEFFPKWGTGASKGKAAFEPILDKLITQHGKASKLHQQGRASLVPVTTENRAIAEMYETERSEDLLKGFAAISEGMFKTGQSMKAAVNRVFRTGEASALGEQAYGEFLANVARDNDQLELLAQGLYKKLQSLTSGPDAKLSQRDVTTLVSKLIELDALPGEIAASFHVAEMNPSQLNRVLLSMDNFMKRQRQSLTTIEKLLKEEGGFADEATRQKLLDAFNDEVFPFMERKGEGNLPGQQLAGVFERLIKNDSKIVEEFTPAQRRILRRANEGYVLRGAELPLTARQQQVQARQVPDIFDAREGIGQVPFNIDINYRGFTAGLTPSQFRSLARPGVSRKESRESIGQALREGKKIGQPFLQVDWDDAEKVWRVVGHEGRSRSLAVEDVFGAEARMEVQFMPRGMKAADITEEMRNAPVVPEAGGAPLNVPLGAPAPRQNIVPKRVLGDYQGRYAGSLSNEEVARALLELDDAGQRALTQDEVIAAAEEMPAIRQLLERRGNDITIPELLTAMSKSGRTETRLIPREVTEEIPLWDAQRTSWTGQQAQAQAQQWGFDIVQNEFVDAAGKTRSGTFRFEPHHLNVSEMTMFQQRGILPGTPIPPAGGFRTYGEAMAALRSALKRNPDYMAKYGPGFRTVKKPLRIATKDIEDVKALLSAEDIAILKGKGTKFDETALPAEVHSDFKRLRGLQERRKLPKDHDLHSPVIEPLRRTVTTRVDPPRGSDEFEVFLEQAGGMVLGENSLSNWAVNYTRGNLLIREVTNALKRAHRTKTPVQIDETILADIEGHVAATGSVIRDIMESHLPEEFTTMMDLSRKISSHSFEAAKRSGVWMPGSPVGYLPRFFNKASRARIAALMGDIEQEDGGILTRLGISQAQYFKRQWDEMSIDDLNEVYFELREAMTQKGASPKLREYHDQLDEMMSEAGIGVAGLKKALPWLKNERVESDPFLALLQRFGVSQQDKNLEAYFNNMLSAAKGDNGESLMLGGKVVGIVDDTGNVIEIKRGAFKKRSVAKVGDQEAVALTEETVTTEFVPKSLMIELDDGTVHVFENNMLEETGFGILSLGKAGTEAEQGFKATVGNSFARASMRSDLHNSMIQAPMSSFQAMELMDKNVVFGSRNNIVGLVKSAAQVHKVTAPALRTFDSINYGIKSFQTIFRLPFHIANLSSGVFQAHLAGATPKNLAASYMDTMRFLFGDQEFANRVSMVTDLMDVSSGASSLGIVNLLKGDKALIQQAARMHGGGEFAEFLAKADPEMAAKFAEFEDLVIPLSDGTELNMMEFVQMAGEMQLYGTFASSLTRGSRTVADNLVRIKMNALEPSMGGRIAGAPKALMERMANVAESSEVINRTATALALVREGHPMRRAIQIAKEAHVPYEKLTPFERNAMKRFSVYYTFPRHYMPWAWSRFAEDPSKLANISHYLRDQNVISTQEGKPNLVLGDYRIDLGRLNANMEAAGMIAALADRVVMPAAEAMVPGIDPYDTRKLRSRYSDAGITNVGGVASVFLGNNLIPDPDRDMPGKGMFEEATSLVWPLKMVSQLMGKTPTKEETSPYVQYTPFEDWLTNTVYGPGARKVREKHELTRANIAYRRMLKRLQMRAAATEDPVKQARLMNHAREMAGGLRQIASETEQKDFQ